MGARERPFIVMRISPGTPLYRARLPKRRQVEPDGTYLIKVDPVEFQMMMATAKDEEGSPIGQVYPLEEVIRQLCATERKQSKQQEVIQEEPPPEVYEPVEEEPPEDDLMLPD